MHGWLSAAPFLSLKGIPEHNFLLRFSLLSSFLSEQPFISLFHCVGEAVEREYRERIFWIVNIATWSHIISVRALKFLILCLTETVLSLCKISKSDPSKVREATIKLCLDCMSLLAEIFSTFCCPNYCLFSLFLTDHAAALFR